MVDLNLRIFGSFAFKDVYGEVPALSEIRERLDAEFEAALEELESKGRDELEMLLDEQLSVKRELDVKAGAMALPQDKVGRFTELVAKYASAIRARLEKSK